MSYKQIKWLILIIPTLTLGLWEYIRHKFLLSVISMEVGNWLAPVIVFVVTITFLLKLFSILEGIQEELNREKAVKTTMVERERIARELHDGIAQSLFLLSVKMDQLEKQEHPAQKEELQGIRKIVHQVNEYVRHSISNLRYPPSPITLPWMQSIKNMVNEFEGETGLTVHFDWKINGSQLTVKEKVELYACVREALLNIRKHAEASEVWLYGKTEGNGWLCRIEDNGRGFDGDPFDPEDRYGLKIMKGRTEEMGWTLRLSRDSGKTAVEIRKEQAR